MFKFCQSKIETSACPSKAIFQSIVYSRTVCMKFFLVGGGGGDDFYFAIFVPVIILI